MKILAIAVENIQIGDDVTIEFSDKGPVVRKATEEDLKEDKNEQDH